MNLIEPCVFPAAVLGFQSVVPHRAFRIIATLFKGRGMNPDIVEFSHHPGLSTPTQSLTSRLKPLIALLVLCLAPMASGCGSEPSPSPTPDAGPTRRDAGSSRDDAGTDAGTEEPDPDAGQEEPPPDFTLSAQDSMYLRFVPGAQFAFHVYIYRESTFIDSVAISFEGLPEHVHATASVIPEGESHALLHFRTDELARYGSVHVTLVAQSETTRVERPVNLVIEPGEAALDLSFGDGGMVTPALGYPAMSIHAVAVQPDGKSVLVGATGSIGLRDVLVARLLEDGSLDREFGNQGTVVLDVCGGDDYVDAVTVLSDGRILVAGGAVAGPGSCSGRQYQSLLLARYTSAGVLDTTFGGTGVRTFQLSAGSATLHAVTVDSQGRIVAAGTVQQQTDKDFVIVRVTPTGALDTSFSSDGLAWDDVGGDDDGRAVVTLPDDRIVVAGSSSTSRNGMALRRYNVNGTRDTSFVYRGARDWPKLTPRTLHLLGDGKLLVGSTAQLDANLSLAGAVTRVLTTGSPDTSFGINGDSTARTLMNDFQPERLVGLGVLPTGEIVVTVSSTIAGTTDGIGVIYLDANGAFTLRKHLTNLPGAERATTSFLHIDGSLYVAGVRTAPGQATETPFLARYWPY